MTIDQAVELLEHEPLASLGKQAHEKRRLLNPEPIVTYNIDRNINYTNICQNECKFCAFYRPKGHPEAYVLSREQLYEKIEQTRLLGGNQILLQGGINPDLSLDWYVDLLRDLKSKFPWLHIHGFSPTEIYHLSCKEQLEEQLAVSGQQLENEPTTPHSSLLTPHFSPLTAIKTVLQKLKQAGLASLPGGGAEILVDAVRQQVSPKKASADQWLNVCRQWASLGGKGTATMMFGCTETIRQRVEHLDRIRTLQDETGVFTAFIPWTFQPKNTKLSDVPKATLSDYLRMLALSRLFLDNVKHIQASWVTQGLENGALALRFGADDFGSLMIEENVVAAAGTCFKTDLEHMLDAIRSAGFQPVRRDVFYNKI